MVSNTHGSLVTISSAWIYMCVPRGERHLSHRALSKYQDLFTQQIPEVLGIPDTLFWDFQEEYIPLVLIVQCCSSFILPLNAYSRDEQEKGCWLYPIFTLHRCLHTWHLQEAYYLSELYLRDVTPEIASNSGNWLKSLVLTKICHEQHWGKHRGFCIGVWQ